MKSEQALLQRLAQERILVMDGAMGTMIQGLQLTADDYVGDRFQGHAKPLAGCHDVLCLTRPHLIRAVHGEYLQAGADLISTNTSSSAAKSVLR